MGGSRNLRIINGRGVEVGGINKQIGMKISSDHITSGGGVHNTLGGAHQLWGDGNNKKYQTRKVFPQKFFFLQLNRENIFRKNSFQQKLLRLS